jgi:hypothetical protein
MNKKNKEFLSWFSIFLFLAIAATLISSSSTANAATRNLSQNIDTVSTTTCVNFLNLPAGSSVEGLGTVSESLNIKSSTGNAQVLEENASPFAYRALDGVINGGMSIYGGFADADDVHEYQFSFAEGVTVSSFSLVMLDYGDYNPVGATEHTVSLNAFDQAGGLLATDVLSFTSDGQISEEDDLWISGDATADNGQPGHYTFFVNGERIHHLDISYTSDLGQGATDPFHGISLLCYELTPPDIPTNTICAEFVALEPGSSVEGLGTVHPLLNINSSTGQAVALTENQPPAAYRALNGITNFGMGSIGGFVDAAQEHDYDFSFAPDVTVSSFSLQMLDYGDYNPVGAVEHEVSLIAYDSVNAVVDVDTISFTSDGFISPEDDLWTEADATAQVGQIGNYTFLVEGQDITRVEIEYNSDLGDGATDPLHGIAILCFEPEIEPPDPPQGSICADFASLPSGTSVEGLGTLHPDLNISSSTGNAVALVEDGDPFAYRSLNGTNNFGMGPLGGFGDADRVHDYVFTFSPDFTVSEFTLRMLDYGDYNPVGATEHAIDLVAYDNDGDVVDVDSNFFNSDGHISPEDTLWFTADSSAPYGNPGNIAYTVSGTGITQIELELNSELGEGATDPLFGLAVLCFVPEEPELDPPTAVLDLLRTKTTPEIGGMFEVSYSCSNTAPNLVSAEINGYAVEDGQLIGLVIREPESVRIRNGLPFIIFAPEFSFDVTCADDLGNEVSTSIAPQFTP